jgi:hypothetical protein
MVRREKMTSNDQAPFPGWKAGKGRLMAGMNLTAVHLGELLGVRVHEDHETRYLWFENKAIGRMTVASDTRQPLDFAEVYVEYDADRLQAFREIIDLIIAKLPADVPCRLEDEIDFDRASRLAQENPPIGPL